MAYEPAQSEIDQYGYVRAKIRASNNPGMSQQEAELISDFVDELRKQVNEVAQRMYGRYGFDASTLPIVKVNASGNLITLAPVYRTLDIEEGIERPMGYTFCLHLGRNMDEGTFYLGNVYQVGGYPLDTDLKWLVREVLERIFDDII